jgi:hypothetical protein
MTRTQIADRIRKNLNDEGITYYSVEDITDSIQDAYDEIIVFTESLDAQANIDFENNTTYYNLTERIPDYYRLFKLWDGTRNFFFDVEGDRDQSNYRSDWELATSSPQNGVIVGPSLLGFFGRSVNAIGHFTVYYKAQAPILLANTILKINENYLNLVENYCTADLLEQNQEFTKASKYWSMYEPELLKYRTKIQLLSKSDQVFTRI